MDLNQLVDPAQRSQLDLGTLKGLCDAKVDEACAKYHAALGAAVFTAAVTLAVTFLVSWLVFRRRRGEAQDLSVTYPRFGPFLAQLFGFSVLTLGAMAPLALLFPETFEHDASRLALVQTAVSFVFLYLCWRKSRAPAREAFPLRKVPLSVLVAVPIFAAGLAILGSEFENFVRIKLHLSSLLGGGDWTQLHSPLGASFVVVFGPIFEELYFRGHVLRGLTRQLGGTWAIVVSGVIFGLFHGNPPQILPAMLAGLVLAWLAMRTRSLVPGIALHMLHNATVFLIAPLTSAWFSIPGFNTPPELMEYQPVWFDALGLGLLAIGAVLVRRATQATVSATAPAAISHDENDDRQAA